MLTVLWPLEDYADRQLAYLESIDQIARGMSVGVAGYLAVMGLVIGWHVTGRSAER